MTAKTLTWQLILKFTFLLYLLTLLTVPIWGFKNAVSVFVTSNINCIDFTLNMFFHFFYGCVYKIYLNIMKLNLGR